MFGCAFVFISHTLILFFSNQTQYAPGAKNTPWRRNITAAAVGGKYITKDEPFSKQKLDRKGANFKQ